MQHSGRSSVGSHLPHLSRHTPACSTDLRMGTLLHLAKQQLAKVAGPYCGLLAQYGNQVWGQDEHSERHTAGGGTR